MSTETSVESLLDNEDVKVDLSAPLFNNVSVPAELVSVTVIKNGGKDGGAEGQSIALKWSFLDSAIDMNGKTHQAGFSIVDRLNVKPPSDMNNRAKVQEIALQTAGKIAKLCGAQLGGSASGGEVLKALVQGVGGTLQLRLELDKSGEYQRIKYAKLNQA